MAIYFDLWEKRVILISIGPTLIRNSRVVKLFVNLFNALLDRL